MAETTQVTAELAGRFRSPQLAERFAAVYDSALASWPVPVTARDIPGEYGTTHVQVCGPDDGPPLVLLHGGGCTSAVWFANAGSLAAGHRVYAPDQLGEAGLSRPAGRPARRPADLVRWLDGLLDGLGVPQAALCGHSYGGWLALSYALSRPGRVTRLALLDPTDCFAGLSAGYRLRAVPLLARPTERRARAFYEWEAGRVALDPTELDLAGLGAEFRGSRLILPRRPAAAALRAARLPVLVLLAQRSAAHDVRRVGENARRLLPHATVTTLPGLAHHSMPAADPGQLTEELTAFLA